MTQYPKHIIAVSAIIRNKKDEILLVQTHLRSDTWELPGGQVEEGESLDIAVEREVLEETGLTVSAIGITGVYYNSSNHLLSVVFKAQYEKGDIQIQTEEIKLAKFLKINEDNITKYITRPNMKSRTIDAMRAIHLSPYEAWEVEPYKLSIRLPR